MEVANIKEGQNGEEVEEFVHLACFFFIVHPVFSTLYFGAALKCTHAHTERMWELVGGWMGRYVVCVWV